MSKITKSVHPELLHSWSLTRSYIFIVSVLPELYALCNCSVCVALDLCVGHHPCLPWTGRCRINMGSMNWRSRFIPKLITELITRPKAAEEPSKLHLGDTLSSRWVSTIGHLLMMSFSPTVFPGWTHLFYHHPFSWLYERLNLVLDRRTRPCGLDF